MTDKISLTILFLFTILLCSCKNREIVSKFKTLSDFDKFSPEIIQAEVLFWGEVSHVDAEPVLAFSKILPVLAKAGFKRVITEFSDYKQHDIDICIEDPHGLGCKSTSFSVNKKRSDAWKKVFEVAKGKGLQIIAGDFKKTGDLKSRLRNSLENTGEFKWCEKEANKLSEKEKFQLFGGFSGILNQRAVKDTFVFYNHKHLFGNGIKTIVYYGAAHGQKHPFLPLTYKDKQVGFWGYHLSEQIAESFVSVLQLTKTGYDKPYYDIFKSFKKDEQPGITAVPTTEMTRNHTMMWFKTLEYDTSYYWQKCLKKRPENAPFSSYFDYILFSE